MMVEIRDENTPQGWHWGDKTPGLLPGISLVPAEMIGQAIDTGLAVEGPEEYAIWSIKVAVQMNKRIQRGLPTMWALDKYDDQLWMSVYFPTLEGCDAFEKQLSKLPGWDASLIKRKLRMFA